MVLLADGGFIEFSQLSACNRNCEQATMQPCKRIRAALQLQANETALQ